MTVHRIWIFAVVLTLCAPAWTPVFAQATPIGAQQREETASGTVVSSSPNTMVVRTGTGEYVLFVFDRDAIKPRTIPVGSRVQVVSTPGEEGVRMASSVAVEGATTPAPAQRQAPAQQQAPGEAIPPSVRRIEREVERQVRKYQVGVRTGVAFDPELILVGVHARLGPVFTREVSFRPNAEFAFGELTSLVALNLEAVYRLPLTARQGRWSAYIGAGPGFNFSHENLERTQDGGSRIDIGDFDFEAGLNILTGIQFRSGLFLELKGTAYARPHMRIILGFNF